ncbi:hypothetical protein F5Y10DRAFT_234596 [Nemania abortiva]|nr:hypothetical protein F5Y10DRAFT_234596 [Nemania abortiva]
MLGASISVHIKFLIGSGSNLSPNALTNVPSDGLVNQSDDALTDLSVQHGDAGKRPPECLCGKPFTRPSSLKRHINEKNGALEHLCPACIGNQGNGAFKRSRDLRKHLQSIHGYDNARLEELFPSSQARGFAIPVCHFAGCEYSRPDFKDKSIQERRRVRPFHRQSDYTKHMKLQHNWSPYPCNVPDCKRTGKNGFFGTLAFETHYKKEHSGILNPIQNCRATFDKCNYCGKMLHASGLGRHQIESCKGEVKCSFCDESYPVWFLESHEKKYCGKRNSSGS